MSNNNFIVGEVVRIEDVKDQSYCSISEIKTDEIGTYLRLTGRCWSQVRRPDGGFEIYLNGAKDSPKVIKVCKD